MNIHEYQAKELFKKYDVPVPEGHVVRSVDEAVSAAESIGTFPVVIKAQAHTGGRGKAGGVKVAGSMEEVRRFAGELIGMRIVTNQTGPEGKPVSCVLVDPGVDISKELYLGIIPDRSTASIVIMASEAGGVDIEEVAAKTPEKIIKVAIDPIIGIQPFHARTVAYGLGQPPEVTRQIISMVRKLYRLFVDYDCSQVEINPLIITGDGKVAALDAKINFDDNALYRHVDIQEMRDAGQEDPLEVEASKHSINYIKMDGNIGNMVNGAGLAMATMDIIKQVGAEPANFLDVGGGASAEMVEHGFRIILSDENVKGILINIFGGILRCDVLASGIVQAAKKVDVGVPVVVRMEGTNAEIGREILGESGLNLISATDLRDAAGKIADIVK